MTPLWTYSCLPSRPDGPLVERLGGQLGAVPEGRPSAASRSRKSARRRAVVPSARAALSEA